MPQDFRDPCVITSFKKSNYIHTFGISLPNSRQMVLKVIILCFQGIKQKEIMSILIT